TSTACTGTRWHPPTTCASPLPSSRCAPPPRRPSTYGTRWVSRPAPASSVEDDDTAPGLGPARSRKAGGGRRKTRGPLPTSDFRLPTRCGAPRRARERAGSERLFAILPAERLAVL